MVSKRVVFLAAAAVVLTGLGASANQPTVRLADLKPMVLLDTSNALTLLMVDPWAATDLRIEPLKGYATLDINADPFVAR